LKEIVDADRKLSSIHSELSDEEISLDCG
jgi:hypothetical protein